MLATIIMIVCIFKQVARDTFYHLHVNGSRIYKEAQMTPFCSRAEKTRDYNDDDVTRHLLARLLTPVGNTLGYNVSGAYLSSSERWANNEESTNMYKADEYSSRLMGVVQIHAFTKSFELGLRLSSADCLPRIYFEEWQARPWTRDPVMERRWSSDIMWLQDATISEPLRCVLFNNSSPVSEGFVESTRASRVY